MLQLRKYAVVKYAWTKEQPVIHIHHLLKSYHWVALDAQHVFLTTTYAPRHHGTLDSHPDVLLLPSLQTSIAVSTHARDRQKQHLYGALQRGLGVGDAHTAYDVVAAAVKLHGVRFEPDL